MDRLDLRGIVVRLASSLLAAVVFHFGWLAVFITAYRSSSAVAQTLLWLLAPVITAAGFAQGIAVAERLGKKDRTSFIRIYVWPLVGCAIGAAAVSPFGPMLIGFGMFAAGTASLVLREVVRHRRSDRG